MKRFCINVLCVCFAASIVLLALTWYNATAIKRANWKLPEDTHIIAIGPSTTKDALNENHIKGFRNISNDAMNFSCLTPMLPKILDDNPQIDTVLINHGRFQFKHMTDVKNTMEAVEITYKLPYLLLDVQCRNDWEAYLTNVNFYSAILSPNIVSTIWHLRHPKTLKDFGFRPDSIERLNLENNSANWGIAWYNKKMFEHGGNTYTKKWILENCSETDYWTRRAIDICKQRGVVPVLFFTPLYQYDRWCTLEGYCEYMKDYDPNILIADYEDFQFPDDSYYGDVHHLNKYGAEYFTTHIAEHGFHVIPLKDWMKSKGH